MYVVVEELKSITNVSCRLWNYKVLSQLFPIGNTPLPGVASNLGGGSACMDPCVVSGDGITTKHDPEVLIVLLLLIDLLTRCVIRVSIIVQLAPGGQQNQQTQ